MTILQADGILLDHLTATVNALTNLLLPPSASNWQADAASSQSGRKTAGLMSAFSHHTNSPYPSTLHIHNRPAGDYIGMDVKVEEAWL